MKRPRLPQEGEVGLHARQPRAQHAVEREADDERQEHADHQLAAGMSSGGITIEFAVRPLM